MRDMAAGRPGLITKTGLDTFVQKRVDGVTLRENHIKGKPAPDSYLEGRSLYEARRDRVVAAIPDARSEGTFFAWLRLPEGLTVDRILDEARVALAPGEGFGPAGAGRARISLAVSDDVLDEGLDRLRSLFARG